MESSVQESQPNRKTVVMLACGIVALVILAGFLAYRHYHPPKVAVTLGPLKTFNYTDPMGKLSLDVPASWQFQAEIATPARIVEQLAFAPASEVTSYKQQHGNASLEFVTVQIFQSSVEPKAWFDSLGLGTPATAQSLTINSYPAYGAKTIGPAGMDDHYVFAHNGTIAHLVFHQQVTLNSTKTDNTKYLSDYDRLATSLKFLQ